MSDEEKGTPSPPYGRKTPQAGMVEKEGWLQRVRSSGRQLPLGQWCILRKTGEKTLRVI